MEMLLILLSAGLDRLRGMGLWAGTTPWAILNGWVIAALLGHPWDLWTPAIAALFALGSAPGWGNPMGRILAPDHRDFGDYEWWQVGPLRKDATLALAFRGAMWGLPLLALYGIPNGTPALWVVPVAYAVAFPVSTWLATLIPASGFRKWQWAEAIRGGLGAAAVWGLTLL